MNANKLSTNSKRMATFCLFFILAIFVMNVLVWFVPAFSENNGDNTLLGTLGLNLSVTNDLFYFDIQIAELAWWQKILGFIISTIPLAFLMWGLLHLRALFGDYAQADYFSSNSAKHMANFGRSIIFWVIANFLCEPLLTILATITLPEGQRLMTLSFTADSFMALFIAGCIMVIAQILNKAKEMDHENKQFV